jgi:hypothetical protein
MRDLPNHASSEVRHVRLFEVEGLLAARQRLHELAGKDAAVVIVLLLWCILRGRSERAAYMHGEAHLELIVLPAREVERLLLLVLVLGVHIRAKDLWCER